jgi:LemA protein
MEPIYVILGVIAVVVIGLILIFNGLVAARQRCNQAFADIDVQLKQRRDLVPNLVETVKGYATHERETFDRVIAARAAAQGARGPNEIAQAEGALSGALGRLFALAEAYPDLKASANFSELQRELSMVEDKLSAARRFYNSAVADYNTQREQFPGALLAGPFGFAPRDTFDLGEGERASLSVAPEVKFGG